MYELQYSVPTLHYSSARPGFNLDLISMMQCLCVLTESRNRKLIYTEKREVLNFNKISIVNLQSRETFQTNI